MGSGIVASILDSLRHRFGPASRPPPGDTPDHQPTRDEARADRARHTDAEARLVGRTMADPTDIRAFGRGRRR